MRPLTGPYHPHENRPLFLERLFLAPSISTADSSRLPDTTLRQMPLQSRRLSHTSSALSFARCNGDRRSRPYRCFSILAHAGITGSLLLLLPNKEHWVWPCWNRDLRQANLTYF
jgi:hypothetical protein